MFGSKKMHRQPTEHEGASKTEELRDAQAISSPGYKDLETQQLLKAALMGEEQMLRTLIEQGAQLNVTDADGRTAFDIAMQHNHIDCAAILAEQMPEGSEISPASLVKRASGAIQRRVSRKPVHRRPSSHLDADII